MKQFIANLIDRGKNEITKYYKKYTHRRFSITINDAMILYDAIKEKRPRNILELGSGFSTLIFASYSSRYGAGVTSLEHDKRSYILTSKMLFNERLNDNVDLQRCDIVDGYYNGEPHPLIDDIDFVFIDGPPMRPYGRQRTLPEVYPYLTKDAVVYLHDANREHEIEIVSDWRREYNFDLNKIDSDTGMFVLTNIRKIDE